MPSMLKSMTGFGRGEGESTLGRVLVESRSVNHRYCDINIKLPKRLTPFENRIKEIIRSQISRGRIDLSLKLDTFGEERVQLQVDSNLAEQYFQALLSLKERFHLQGEITLELLTGAKDLISAKEEPGDIEPYWEEIVPVLKQSLKEMDEMKRMEGESLSRDLLRRLERITKQLEEIKGQFPSRLEAYRNRLRERFHSLLEGVEVDPYRFQQEIALLAERADITEEMVRAESHLSQFAFLFKGEEPVGRKMDFLLQEIHREVNTVSAKANDAEISQKVVEIKSELEKIREQVQNIE
ncbi:MAG: YicC/YloC family endoribonuclease [Thermodesulfobacteriota bacterium]|nr:YicC/YloC family endoribonuclease [Thermodesulfobacteriota bacterium]